TTYNPSESWWNDDMVMPLANLGLSAADYTVIALYAGNYADYQHPARIHLPAVLGCSVSGISPATGPPGTIVTVTGANFDFTKNTSIVYSGNPAHPFTVNHKIVSSQILTIDTSTLQSLPGWAPAPGSFSIQGPGGNCGT